jgi:hypothetical protein
MDQYLTRIGSLNLGLYGYALFGQNNSTPGAIATWMANNYTRTQTVFYDTVGAGVAPVSAADYTHTWTRSNPDTVFNTGLLVPLYMPIGRVGLYVMPGINYSFTDQSHLYTESYSPPQQAGGGSFTNVASTDSLASVTSNFGGSVNTTLYLPPVIGGSAQNALLVMLNGHLSYYFKDPEVQTTVVQDFNYAGGGAALVVTNLGTATDTLVTTTYQGNPYFYAAPAIQHLIYIDLGDATLAFGPQLRVAAYDKIGANRTQVQTVNKVDNNSDGLFTNAADRITTTTITYGNNTGMAYVLDTSFSLPTAVNFHPRGALFGIIVGATAAVGYAAGFMIEPEESAATTVHVVDGTGAAVGTDVVTLAGPAYSTTTWTSSWSFTASMNLCLTFYLSGNGTRDILFNGDPAANLVTVQATIPLP